VVAAGVTFILVLVAAFVGRPGLRLGMQTAALLASAATLALAVNAGHLGGRLVYVHGAARAYIATPTSPAAEPPAGALHESPDRD